MNQGSRNKRKTGAIYEGKAAAYLEALGYEILARNYHAGIHGEIDLVAKKQDGTYVFCECKYRKEYKYGGPLSAVTKKKQQQICKVAMYYYAEHGLAMNVPCRFDVFAFYGNETMKHIENAFNFQGVI